MSAVVLMTVALGVLKALDTSSVASANLKRRSVAASVGQKDQERLRAMLATDLAGLDQTRTILSNGISFTVHSTATWVFDGAGTTDCTTNISNDYLKISSAVTWPSMGTGRAAVEDSIVSPPVGSFNNNEGSISATVTKATGVGAAGVPVTVSGPSSASGSTNANGCIIFGHLPVGNYTVSVNKPGWVDHNGNQSVSQATSVIAQTTNSVSFDYDVAGAIDAIFDTKRVRATKTGTVWPVEPAKADRVRVGNGGLAAPFVKGFGTANTWVSAIPAEPLFPFTDGYKVYAGDCNANDPAVQAPTPQTAAVSIAPAGGRDPETVRMPALDLLVQRKTGTASAVAINLARVRITPTTPGCSNTVLTRSTAKITPLGGTAAQALDGLISDYALPYGTYSVCADDSTTTPAGSRLNRFQTQLVTLNNAAGTSATITIRNTAPNSPAGTCP